MEPTARDRLEWRVFAIDELRGIRGLLTSLVPWQDASPWWLEIRDRATAGVLVRLQFTGNVSGYTEPLSSALRSANEYLERAAEVDWRTFVDEFEGAVGPQPGDMAKYIWRNGRVERAVHDDGWTR